MSQKRRRANVAEPRFARGIGRNEVVGIMETDRRDRKKSHQKRRPKSREW